MNNPTKNIIDDHFQKQSNQDGTTGNKIQFIPIKQSMMSQNQVKTLKPYQHLNIDLTGSQFQKAGHQMLGSGHHMQSQPILHATRRSSLGPVSPGAKSTNSNESTGRQPISGNYQQRMSQIKGEKQGSQYSDHNRKKQEQLKQLLTKQQSNRGNSYGYFKNTISKQKNDSSQKILIQQDYEHKGKDQFSTLQNKSQNDNKILKKSARGQRNMSAGGLKDIQNMQAYRQGVTSTIEIHKEGRGRLDLEKKSQRSRSGSKGAATRVKDFNRSQRSRSNSSNTRVKRLSTQMGTLDGYSNHQSQGTLGTYSLSKPLRIEGTETFGQTQMQELTSSGTKAKSNTEYFKDLYQKSCRIQNKVIQDIEESNKLLLMEANKSPSRQSENQYIELSSFPRISQKSRSFKEVADFLLKQMEFLQSNGAFKKGLKGILKKGLKSHRSNSPGDKEDLQNKSVINLKQIQEKRDLEEQLVRLQSENKYCKMQNQNLQDQLKDLNLQFAKESQKFMKEFENQHKDMEQQFQSLQAHHQSQQQLTQNQAEVEIKEKTIEMDKYLYELRQCQQELKDLNNGKRRIRDFEQKNTMELRAELDFSKDQVVSLEAEIRAMDIELEMLRGKQNQQRQLENEILSLETANVQLKGQLDVLKNQKEFFEKEYKVQQTQIERQKQRLSQSPQGAPLPREKSPIPQTIHSLQDAIGNNMNYLNELQNARSRSRSGGQKVEQFRDTRSRSPQQHTTYQKMVPQQSVEDSRRVQQNQGKMIEKLLLKIKKMKQHQVDEDFAIFNLDNDLQAAKSSQQMQNTKQQVFMDNYNVELKTYQDNIQELYDAMMLQCENKVNKQSDYTEQFQQLKSYLKLQHQLGNLRKYKFDEKFQMILNIPKLICIADEFNENEQRHRDGKVYLNPTRLIQQKNSTFQQFYQQVMDTLGQFFVMYQQINLYRNKSNQLQINLDCYKEMQIGTDEPQSQYESRMIKQLQSELDKKVQELIELNRTVEVLKSESEIPDEVFKQIIASIISDKITISQGQLITPEDTLKLGLTNKINSSEQINRKNRFSTKKEFVNKPPQPQMKNKNIRGMSAGKAQSHSKIFGGKKPWLDSDPSIQQELDRLKSYEMEYDVVEKERDLYQCEYNKQRKDNEALAEQIKIRTQEYQELDLQYQEQLTKLTDAKEKILHHELDVERYEKKVKKLSGLNEELRALIEQERDMYLEEIETVKNTCDKKLKSKTSHDVLVRNKLMQLATHYRVFVASSFNVEQILDSILEQLGSKSSIRRAPPTQAQRAYPMQEQTPGSISQIERKQTPEMNESPQKEYQTPAMELRQQSQTRQPRFEPDERQDQQYQPPQRNDLTDQRSISKNMDKMVSKYEEDLRKIEAMKQQNLNQKYHKDLFNSQGSTQLVPQDSPSRRQKSQDVQRSPERAEQFTQQNIQRSPSARGYSRNKSRVEESFQYNNNADQLNTERSYKQEFEDDYEISYTKKAREQLAKVKEIENSHPYKKDEQEYLIQKEEEMRSYQPQQSAPSRESMYYNEEAQKHIQTKENQDVIYRHQKTTQNTFLKNLKQEIWSKSPKTYKYDVLTNDIVKLQREHEEMQIRNEQQKILNNERNNFQEKLQNLRKKLNGPSVAGSLGSTNQFPLAKIEQEQQFQNIESFQNPQSFLKQPNQSPKAERDMFSPQQNSQLEQSINQRLREFENEQMQRQAQIAGRQ